ncbi:MAG: hypothetical protein H5T86_16695, partial [Armatimonadetes bacterium]|nr:hypothetical protein [Armatimonadota bacterium]
MSINRINGTRANQGRRYGSQRSLIIGGLIGIALIHMVAGAAGLDVGINTVLALTNLMALARATELVADQRRLLIFLAGYAALFALLAGVAHSFILFAVFGFLYVGCFHVPLVLGLVVILLVCVVTLTPYWLQLWLLLSVPYVVVVSLWRQVTDKFVLIALLFGFMLLVAIALPVLSIVFKSAPQTLMVTAQGKDFQAALANTFWTATVSTLIVLIFGVPLAYAMARAEFRGKD